MKRARAIIATTAIFAALTACPSRTNPNRPTAITPQYEPSGQIANVMTVRIYADQGHRREILGWKLHFERTLNRANRVLESDVGIAFEVTEAKAWERKEPIPDSLTDALNELQTIDPADGADLVVGLVSALPMFTPEVHQLGIARAFGKHIVLRGMDDPGEADILSVVSEDAEEGEDVYRERVAHRETAVLLHELGHIFGALHIEESTSFMNPRWAQHQTQLDEKNLEMIELVVGHRLRTRKVRDLDLDAVADIKKLLEKPGWERHDTADLTFVRAAIEHGALVETPRHPDFEEARSLVLADKPEEAWAVVSRLRAEAPYDPNVLELACSIAVRRAKKSLADADDACGAAAIALSDRTGPLLNLAWAQIEAKNELGAHKSLAGVRAYCETAPCDPHARGYLAQLHANLGLITFAEELARTATTAPEAQRALERAASVRRDCGLRKADAIPREREDEYVRACHEARAFLSKRNTKTVLSIVARMRETFTDTPGLHLFACQAHLFAMSLGRAEQACRSAITLWPEMSEAHFYLAVLANMSGKNRDAVRHAERARELDPRMEAAWSLLAAHYRRTHDNSRLKTLEADFQATFGRPLAR